MSEWKEEATKRKDTKHFKDPALDKEPSRAKRKKVKSVRIVAYPTLENKWVKESRTAGWYETVKDAQKAIEAKATGIMAKLYTYKIEES